MLDLVIIGSGPAGLSAAVYAKRAMLEVLVLEKEPFQGGQIINTEQVDNYLGLYGTNGYDLAMRFKEHADKLEVPFAEGQVQTIEQKEDHRIVVLEDGTKYETKAVLIATGAKHRQLGAEGEKEFAGAGVSYCATCDGAFFRDKDVAVVGGGDVALEDALYLAKGCRKVYLIHRRDGLRAAKVLQDAMNQTENIEFLPFYEVKKIQGDGMVQSVTLLENQTKEEKELSLSGVFVAIGMQPNTEFLQKDMAHLLDKQGYILAGEDGVTAEKGIFAAGDVRTKELRQIATAVSDGANAIYSIEKFLNY